MRKHITGGVLGVVALATGVLSFVTLRDLAEACGIHGWLAWLLPISIDAGGVVASLVWTDHQARQGAQRFGMVVTLGAVTLSILGNTAQHVYSPVQSAMPLWLVIIMAAVPPIMLGAAMHLAVNGNEPPAPPADRQGLPDTAILELAAQLLLPSPEDTEADRREKAARIASWSPGLGRPTLAKLAQISENDARKVLVELAEASRTELTEATAP